MLPICSKCQLRSECMNDYESEECKTRIQTYNKARHDMKLKIQRILEDNAIYNIDCIDTLENQMKLL